jgi:hypothetical protein
MATILFQDVPASSGTMGFLPSELVEKQVQALEHFQSLLVTILDQYGFAFRDIMKATNGEIAKHLRVMPSVVKERTQDLLDMNFRAQGYTIFSGFERTTRLITNAIDTARKGLNDFYTIGDALLAEKAKDTLWAQSIDAKPLERFMASKKVKQDELAAIEKQIAAFEADILLLKVELDMAMNDYWRNTANSYADVQEVSTLFLFNTNVTLGDGTIKQRDIENHDTFSCPCPKQVWYSRANVKEKGKECPQDDLSPQYREAIADKQKFMVRVLRSQFDFSFSALEGIVTPTMRFATNPRTATLFRQHPTRIPYELQERIHKLPDHLIVSKPTLVIGELSEAVKFVQSEYEKAFQLMIEFYQIGIATGSTDGQPVPRVQQTVNNGFSVDKLERLGFKHFELQLAYGHGEIQRYRREIDRIRMNRGTMVQSDMVQAAENAKEKLLQAMTEVERMKNGVRGLGLSNLSDEKREQQARASAEEILEGAEPWKEMKQWHDKMNEAFIRWQHENPEGGGTDGFLKALGLADWQKEPPSKEVVDGIMNKLGIEI